jgi:von Willebrand factor type A domain
MNTHSNFLTISNTSVVSDGNISITNSIINGMSGLDVEPVNDASAMISDGIDDDETVMVADDATATRSDALNLENTKESAPVTQTATPSIVFVLDESGSMAHLGNAPINTYNEFMEEQKKALGDFRATLILFNSDVKVVYENSESKNLQPLTDKDYHPSKMTALYDAIGEGICLQKKNNNNNVVFVILTDGDENSSNKYDKKYVKDNIKVRESLGWKFMYLGANQDAFLVGTDMGINRSKTFDYNPDGLGTVMRSLSAEVSTCFIPTMDNITSSLFSSPVSTPAQTPALVQDNNIPYFGTPSFTPFVNFSALNSVYTPTISHSISIAEKNTSVFTEIIPPTFNTKKSQDGWKCMICRNNTTDTSDMFDIYHGKVKLIACKDCIDGRKFEKVFSHYQEIRNDIENWQYVNKKLHSPHVGRSNKRKGGLC